MFWERFLGLAQAPKGLNVCRADHHAFGVGRVKVSSRVGRDGPASRDERLSSDVTSPPNGDPHGSRDQPYGNGRGHAEAGFIGLEFDASGRAAPRHHAIEHPRPIRQTTFQATPLEGYCGELRRKACRRSTGFGVRVRVWHGRAPRRLRMCLLRHGNGTSGKNTKGTVEPIKHGKGQQGGSWAHMMHKARLHRKLRVLDTWMPQDARLFALVSQVTDCCFRCCSNDRR